MGQEMTRKHKSQNTQCWTVSTYPTNTHSDEVSGDTTLHSEFTTQLHVKSRVSSMCLTFTVWRGGRGYLNIETMLKAPVLVEMLLDVILLLHVRRVDLVLVLDSWRVEVVLGLDPWRVDLEILCLSQVLDTWRVDLVVLCLLDLDGWSVEPLVLLVVGRVDLVVLLVLDLDGWSVDLVVLCPLGLDGWSVDLVVLCLLGLDGWSVELPVLCLLVTFLLGCDHFLFALVNEKNSN